MFMPGIVRNRGAMSVLVLSSFIHTTHIQEVPAVH